MNRETQLNVSIVTVTYNASDFILTYLDAVLKLLNEFPSMSLVVVDNASSDDTVNKMLAFSTEHQLSSRFKIVEAGGNIGFGRGCNLGAKSAETFSPDVIWFLNPDTVVSVETPLALMELVSEQNCDFAGSTLEDENGQLRSGAFRFPTPITVFMSTSLLGFIARAFPSKASTIALGQECVKADWLTGASFMVKKQAFEALDGFDSRYFLYFEEVDLFYRAGKLGMKVLSTPKSTVYHQSGASTGMNARRNTVKQPRRPAFWFESRRYFYLKNFGAAIFLATDIAFISGMLFRRFKNFVQRKPNLEPESLLRDVIGYSILAKGTKLD